MSDNRDVGVTFGDVQDDLEADAYPLSAETLLDRYGHREVEHAGGSATLRELLDGSSEPTYESADEVHQAVLNMVGEEAEGRQGYTDREPNARGDDFEQSRSEAGGRPGGATRPSRASVRPRSTERTCPRRE